MDSKAGTDRKRMGYRSMNNKIMIFPQKVIWGHVEAVGESSVRMEPSDFGMLFINETNEEATFHCKKISIGKILSKDICVACKGETGNNAAGYLIVNGCEASVNGETIIPTSPLKSLHLEVHVNADSSLLINEISIETADGCDLIDYLDREADVLVVTPTYPSYKNLYLSAFAHSRNKAYRDSGLKIQVASLGERNNSMSYILDGIPVYRGEKADLKKLLRKKQYKTLVIHFVDEKIFQILDGYLTDEKAIFICHGPETLFEVLPNKVRPYFTPPLPDEIKNDLQKGYVKKYAKDSRIEWVFVSEWLKHESEKVLDIRFRNAHVIGNFINEKVFPYVEKKAEDRKKILIIRKYDNICQHSIDQIVLAIRELAHRPFFNELEFSFYGDGNYYNELLDPIKDYPNIKFYRTFLPQQKIAEVHRQHGILLLPSRHDAHAVSMSEGASSGLVVIGSNVTSNPYFMDNENNHTMVDPEDPVALAYVIERLYYDPNEFLAISKRLSDFVHAVSNREATIEREISLIQRCKEESGKNNTIINGKPGDSPVLSLLVYANGHADGLDRTLFSLINHDNAVQTEVLVACMDDDTRKIISRYENHTKGIVRGIDVRKLNIGDAVNRCVEEAKGNYTKLVFGNDWLDSKCLEILTIALRQHTEDAILTDCSYEIAGKAELLPCIQYTMLHSGSAYSYKDLLLPNYGFGEYGPLIYSIAIKTEVVKEHGLDLSDEAYQTNKNTYEYCMNYIGTVRYYSLDLYRIFRDAPMALPSIREKGSHDLRHRVLSMSKKAIKAAVPYGIIWYKQNRTR